MYGWTTKLLTSVLVAGLCGAPELAAAAGQQNTEQNQQAPSQASTPPAQGADQPAANTTPSADQNQNGNAAPQTGSPQTLPDAPSAQPAPKQDNTPQENSPSGTAAAQAGQTKGGVASKPAGAAIAPAKQRRNRSLLIKLGLIAGAGVAIGSVYALSQGSPSRPPGAH